MISLCLGCALGSLIPILIIIFILIGMKCIDLNDKVPKDIFIWIILSILFCLVPIVDIILSIITSYKILKYYVFYD